MMDFSTVCWESGTSVEDSPCLLDPTLSGGLVVLVWVLSVGKQFRGRTEDCGGYLYVKPGRQHQNTGGCPGRVCRRGGRCAIWEGGMRSILSCYVTCQGGYLV